MSVRRKVVRRRVVAGSAAVVAAAAAVVLPGVAQAAQTGAGTAAKSPLVLTLGRMQAGPLMPGGRAEVFDLSVSNTSGTDVAFGSELGGGAHGALPVGDNQVTLGMTPVHAPATALTFGGQDGGLIGSFYPKGGQFGDAFTLPAHATYTWKVTLAATKAWPVNDDRLQLGFNIGTGGGATVAKQLDLEVGTAKTGGPIVQTLTGGGSALSAAQPLVMRYTLTNRTGAPVAQSLQPGLLTTSYESVPLTASLAYDLWQNDRWVPLGTDSAGLPAIPAHWANGASVSYTVRVRVAGWDAGTGKGDTLGVEASYDPFASSADRVVTVTR
ncbi:hypothetical protein [Streptacidiphilus sp. MAP5-3]|uniref:hypothetical protein n=1 Tax=unclassified Streptacidiphilus TaxID=2643834 RepID=UPI003518BBFB